jgi:hypothetical protein
MSEIVIFDWDAAKAIDYEPRNFKKPTFPIKLAIDPAPEIQDQIAADPLLHQRIVDAVKEAFDKAGKIIEPKARLADQQMGSAATATAKSEVMQKFMKFCSQELDLGQKVAGQAAKSVWESLAEQRSDYKKYKLKTGFKIVSGFIGVGLGIAGAPATVAAGGAGLPVAIIALVRASVDLGKTLANSFLDAESIGERLTSMLITLHKRYKAASKPGVVSRELGASIANSLLQTERSSISKAKSDLGLWKDKLNGVRDTAHKLSKDLNKILDDSALLEQELLGKRGNAKAAKALASLTKLRKETAGLLDAIPKAHLRVEKGLKALPVAKQGIQELEGKSAAWTQTFDKYFGIFTNAALGGYGDVSAGIAAANETEKVVLAWATVGVSTANDLASAGVDAYS